MNALGYLRVMFTVDDIDDTLDRLVKHGVQPSAVTWSGTRTSTGSATSAGLKAFSSGSPKNSAELELAAATYPTGYATRLGVDRC